MNYITEDDIEVSLINILKSDELKYDFIQCDPNPNLKELPDATNRASKKQCVLPEVIKSSLYRINPNIPQQDMRRTPSQYRGEQMNPNMPPQGMEDPRMNQNPNMNYEPNQPPYDDRMYGNPNQMPMNDQYGMPSNQPPYDDRMYDNQNQMPMPMQFPSFQKGNNFIHHKEMYDNDRYIVYIQDVKDLGVFLEMIPGQEKVADICRCIGRIAFPLFVFMIVEKTK